MAPSTLTGGSQAWPSTAISASAFSGWRYRPWRGIFYPKELPQRLELAFAAKTFRAIEINGTFYSLQRPEYFEAWAAQTPEDFRFAIKGSRFITHNKRLKDVEAPLANFFAQGLFNLGDKLGPFLWQFAPRFRFDAERLEAFFKLLPRNTDEAARLARRHDRRVSGRSVLTPKADLKLRHSIEIRHASFIDPAFIELLRRYDVALVCADTVDWPRLMDLTSDFIYCRLHGSEQLYVSGYEDAALDSWAGALSPGREEGSRKMLSASSTGGDQNAGRATSSSSSTTTPRCVPRLTLRA